MFISHDLKSFLQTYFSGKRQCSFHAIPRNASGNGWISPAVIAANIEDGGTPHERGYETQQSLWQMAEMLRTSGAQ
jgi:hypothetical protein